MTDAEPTDKWQAISYKHNALNAFAEAYEMTRLEFRVGQMALIPRPGLSADASEQRKQLLLITQRLINVERDIKMDRAVRLWTEFRKMEPADDAV